MLNEEGGLTLDMWAHYNLKRVNIKVYKILMFPHVQYRKYIYQMDGDIYVRK